MTDMIEEKSEKIRGITAKVINIILTYGEIRYGQTHIVAKREMEK